MKDNKELLEQTIKEDLEKEAQEILRTLEASEVEELSEEKQAQMKKKIDEKIEAYEFEKICSELPKEYQDALRAGMEMKKQESKEEEKSEERKVIRKKKRRKVYVALAAVLVMAMGVSISSVGDGRNLMQTIKSMVGEREVVQVDSGEDNLVMEVESEEEAYQAINDELGIIPVKIGTLPQKTKFVKAKIEKDMQVAEFYYKHKDENIVYIINGDQAKNSIGIGIEDEIVENYILEVQGIPMEIKGCEISATKGRRYYASFKYKDIKYFLIGIMNKGEFEGILNNLYFS